MNPTLRYDILRRDGFTCRYCGRSAPAVTLEADHVDPRANGGLDTESNLVTACGPCNRGKRDKRGILPPPPSQPKEVDYPIGMFFNLHRRGLGLPELDRSNNIAWQGWVIGVQGSDIWCQTFNEDGDVGFVKCLPRNDWKGWDFFETSRDMRAQTTYESYRAGLCPWSDVERFEEFDAIRLNDQIRLAAFYRTHPRFDPSGPYSTSA